MRDEKQAAVSDPLIGQVFGDKYTVRRLIGRGGVGLVYLAEDTQTHEELVLKLLSPDWSRKPEAVRRFEREAERLGGVRHPNIVRLLDQGHDSGRAYLAMEYLEGELLSDFIHDRKHLDLGTFVPIAAQILKGIGHAHSRGVMLRDIKPANIMLCERKGRANFVKILDFGLAKLIRDERPVTEEHVLGTAGYLAPEVIQGSRDVDLRVDVFSLGALFYFMLSGRLPFEGSENATVFYKTIHDDPTALHEVLPTDHEIPEGLIALVHQCMSKDPADRPDDANAIVEQLIDVVPASLFRLPKIVRTPEPGVPQRVTGEVPRPGYGNTGLVQLVGDQAISGRHAVVPATPAPAPRADSEPVTLPQDPHHTGPIEPIETVERSNRGLVVGLAAAVVLLGGGLGYVALRGTTANADASTAAEASVASAGSPKTDGEGDDAKSYDAELTAVATLIDEGDLEAASDKLDGLRGPARDTPSLAGRVGRLDTRLTAAKLMATAAAFEAKGETEAAIATYRDVLKSDPTHVAARKKLVELAPDAPPPTAVEPATADDELTYAPVDIGSRPLANLYIDGEPSGTTPFKGKLSVGTHTIRMTARGYQAWQGELEVRTSGTEDLRVRLVGKGRGKKPSRGEPSPPPETSPPKATSPSEKEPAKAPKASKKKSPFLPTKDDSGKNGGGVFLPTKD